MSNLKFSFSCSILLILTSAAACAQTREEIEVPNVLGYQTLKCDFHLHSVFSDGDVWPTVRVQEAWQEGLDVIAITDPIEYQPHSQDIDADHNRGFEIAKPLADQFGILLIKGAEISRQMPPGHLNAIFIKNANLMERESWWEACVEAQEQGAFLFLDHPDWEGRQAEAPVWYPEHTRLLNAGILKGMEIYSHDKYDPEARKWADEKELTILANSGLRAPSSMKYSRGNHHRPVTLVFATEKTEDAVKKALLEHRTAAYFNDTIIGERRFLTPLFSSSIEIKNTKIRLKNQEIKQLMIYNHSDVTYRLKKRQPSVGFSNPDEIVLEAHRTVAIDLAGTSDEVALMSVLKMYYEIRNLITLRGGEKLQVNLEIPNL